MKLKRNLTLLDATALGIGAIIGAGIFVLTGIASGLAGPAVIVSMIVAGVVSALTAYSYVKLGSKIDLEGGTYEYAEKMLSKRVGFATGMMWIVSNIFAGAVVSLGLSSYLNFLFPSLPLLIIASSAPLLLTIVNIVSSKKLLLMDNFLVVIKLIALILLIVVGLPYIHLSNFTPFSPYGISGVMSGAALFFFAFTGFGRSATAAEEIKDPKRNVPLSIVLSLGISTIIYILIGIIAIGLVDYHELANSSSPITLIVEKGIGIYWLKIVMSVAAVAATLSVLISTLVGVSRVTFAMSRRGDLPKVLSKVHEKFGTPYTAVIATGILTSVLVFSGSLKNLANFTNFGSLLVYAVVNLSAVKLLKGKRSMIIPALGLISTVALLFFVGKVAIISGMILLIGIVAYYTLRNLMRKKSKEMSI